MMFQTYKRPATSQSGARGRKNILADESGQAVTEYVLLAAVLTVALGYVMMNLLYDSLQDFFSQIAACVALPVP